MQPIAHGLNLAWRTVQPIADGLNLIGRTVNASTARSALLASGDLQQQFREHSKQRLLAASSGVLRAGSFRRRPDLRFVNVAEQLAGRPELRIFASVLLLIAVFLWQRSSRGWRNPYPPDTLPRAWQP